MKIRTPSKRETDDVYCEIFDSEHQVDMYHLCQGVVFAYCIMQCKYGTCRRTSMIYTLNSVSSIDLTACVFVLQICVLVKDWNTSNGGLSFSNLLANKPSLTRAIKLWTLYADLSEQSPRNNYQTERL